MVPESQAMDVSKDYLPLVLLCWDRDAECVLSISSLDLDWGGVYARSDPSDRDQCKSRVRPVSKNVRHIGRNQHDLRSVQRGGGGLSACI